MKNNTPENPDDLFKVNKGKANIIACIEENNNLKNDLEVKEILEKDTSDTKWKRLVDKIKSLIPNHHYNFYNFA